MKLNNLWNCR